MIAIKGIPSVQVLNNHISLQVAASYTGYSVQYLRRLLRNGKLAGIKIGQLWLVDKDTFEDYVKNMKNSSDQRVGPRNSYKSSIPISF